MDIRHLQYFIEVSRFNSFTRAAEHLFVTQPTISKMIKNLESELGVTLFEREGRKIVLTDAGQVVLEQAQVINKAFKNLEIELNDLLDLKKGHISMGLPPMIGSRFFPSIIGRFREQYPEITIQLVEDGSKKIEEDVVAGNLDIGVVVLPTHDDTLNTFSFVEEDLKLVIHPEHPLAQKETLRLSEVRHEPFILFHDDFVLHDRMIDACHRAGFEPQIMSESSQWDFIGEMVGSKLGVTLLPESICRELNGHVKTIAIVDPIIDWHLGVIWRKDRYLSYATKEWLYFMKEALQDKY